VGAASASGKARLFDNLVGAGEKRRRHVNARKRMAEFERQRLAGGPAFGVELGLGGVTPRL
jgi:hypothetical protein